MKKPSLIMIFMATVMLMAAMPSHAQSSIKEIPHRPMNSEEFAQDIKGTTERNNRVLENMSSVGSRGSCSECPEACETVCGSKEDHECLAELRKERERKFAECRKRGRGY